MIIYVAAVGEELAFRLLLLSLVAGLATRLLRRVDRGSNRGVAPFAIGIAALAFAAVHLPAWSAIGPLSFGQPLHASRGRTGFLGQRDLKERFQATVE